MLKSIPTYNKTKLATLYGITYKCLDAWFDDEEFKSEFGSYRGKVFTPRQVQVIVKHFGPFSGHQQPLELK